MCFACFLCVFCAGSCVARAGESSASGAAGLKAVRLPRLSLLGRLFRNGGRPQSVAEKRPAAPRSMREETIQPCPCSSRDYRACRTLRPDRFAISPTARHNEHPRPGYRTAEPSDSPARASRYRPAAATHRVLRQEQGNGSGAQSYPPSLCKLSARLRRGACRIGEDKPSPMRPAPRRAGRTRTA